VSCHQELVSSAQAALGRIDIALISYGVLGDQATAQEDIQAAQEILNTNFLSPAMLTSVLAKNLELQRHGTLAVITSVAGDRGRRSNYIYGSAKAGLSVYLQGVRSRLVSAGVHVVTIKPGFVATPMTAHVPQGLLFVSAERIGKGIVRAVQTHRDVVYLPWFWRLIMIVIRTIPESIFKKLPI
jgi:short-subunit dehydrogenase